MIQVQCDVKIALVYGLSGTSALDDYNAIVISATAGITPSTSDDAIEEKRIIFLEILWDLRVDPKEDKNKYVKWPCSNQCTSLSLSKGFSEPAAGHSREMRKRQDAPAGCGRAHMVETRFIL